MDMGALHKLSKKHLHRKQTLGNIFIKPNFQALDCAPWIGLVVARPKAAVVAHYFM